MTDRPRDAAAETPIQRALRLKKAAIAAKAKARGGANLLRERVAGVAPGASKPWMKK